MGRERPGRVRATPAATHRAGDVTPIYLPPWRVDVTVRPGAPALLPHTVLARTITAALDAGGAPSPAAIGLILSGDRELAELNEQAMSHRGPTDVLSFPLLPPSAFPPHEGQERDDEHGVESAVRPFVLPPRQRVHLGEIVVSVERAIEQARQGRGGQTGDVRWSAADELRLLVTHGALHICGWDHELPAEEAAMRALERRLLSDSDGS